MLTRKYIGVAVGLFLFMAVCSDNQQASFLPPPSALVDTLMSVFTNVKETVVAGDTRSVSNLLDPEGSLGGGQLLFTKKAPSLSTYVIRRVASWPSLDTLTFLDLKLGGGYARIGFSGAGSNYGYRKQRIRYTYLLFRRSTQGWRLADMSGVESTRYDQYGYEMTIHETDLPPSLRFPRLF